MRRWPKDTRQALRLLAAARYYLPARLESPPEWEEEYEDCLRHGQFTHALELLERIGERNAGHIDEATFWKELYFAARHLAMPDHAQRYEAKLHAALAGLTFPSCDSESR